MLTPITPRGESVGHTAGLVGNFRVEPTSGEGFTDALSNFAGRLVEPGAVTLLRPILSPEEWIRDPYHCGNLAQEVWPKKIEDFTLAAQGNITEVAVTGAIGWGKSALLKMICAYDLYRISCIKDPRAMLGSGRSETILFVMVSTSVSKAKAKLFDPLRALIDATPYFQEHFPYDKALKVSLNFPGHIQVVPGITGEGAVHSEDVIWMGASECNFYPIVQQSKKKRGVEELDVAADLLDATLRRMQTRFGQGGGKLPLCRIVLDSSRQYPDDFLERRIRSIEAGDVGHEAVVLSRSIWEAKEGVTDATGAPIFGEDTFPVEVGSDQRSSRILDESEIPFAIGEVVGVPVELRGLFERDLEGALRDMAGRAVVGLRQLITNRTAVRECVRQQDDPLYAAAECLHPFAAQTTTLRDGVEFLIDLLVDPSTQKPRVNPNRPRAIHVDVGLTTDSLGLAMVHVSDMVMTRRGGVGVEDVPCPACEGVKRVACDRCGGKGHKLHFKQRVRCAKCRGEKEVDCPPCGGTGEYASQVVRPRLYVDLMLEVPPPPTGEIQFDDVESLIERLRGAGFSIPVVTADGTYSVQFIQRQKSAYSCPLAQKLSVDTSKEPFLALREAAYDVAVDGGRRLSFYDYPPFLDQLFHLEDRPRKIDHPARGEKDVADAVAGAAYMCETQPALQRELHAATLRVDSW